VPRLSILIPVLGNLNKLEDTLVSVLENRPDDCQVVVVLDEPYDDPYTLTDEVTFVRGSPGSGLAEQLNLGWRTTAAPIVHVLRCGSAVEPDWAEPALAPFRDPRVASVAPLVLERTDPDEVLTAGVDYRAEGETRPLAPHGTPRQATPPRPGLLGPEAWAAFFRKAAIDQVGGFSPEVGDRLAGVDVGLWLKQAGWRTVFQPRSRVYADRTALRRAGPFREGWETERFFWRWAPQAGWGRSLRGHARLLAAEGLSALVRPWLFARLAGRVVGAVRLAAHHDHWRAIKALSPAPRPPVPEPHFSTSGEPAEPVHALVRR
jgi:GT2 family glycosyltransferase